MACELTPLSAQDICTSSDGGIYKSIFVDGNEITDVEITDGVITNFTMDNVGKWEAYEYDDDDSAYFNETGAREGAKYTADQVAFMKWTKITALKTKFANNLIDCCRLVIVHFLNSGVAKVQGIDIMPDGSWRYSKKFTKATPSSLSGTGAEVDRIELTLNSTGRKLALTTDLTAAEILAL